MKTPQKQRAYHQQILKEVSQMLLTGGKTPEVEIKPIKTSDHAWAQQKVQSLVVKV